MVAAVAIVAIVAFILIPVPKGKDGSPDPPAVALKNEELFHIEAALLVFYGGLLLLTPAFAGVFRGRLPSEISARGAKFEEVAGQSDEIAKLTQAQIDEHTQKIGTLEAEMALSKGKSSTIQSESQGIERNRSSHPNPR